MTVTIRLATAADACDVAKVQVASSQFVYSSLLTTEYLDSQSVDNHEATWRHRFETMTGFEVWLAVDAETVVGFAAINPSDELDAGHDAAELGFLYVAPDLIGHGVGRQLFEHLVQRLGERGFRDATMWVFAENVRARRFYERLGWQSDGALASKDRGGRLVHQVRYRLSLEEASPVSRASTVDLPEILP